ncbi:hypothetical protein GQ42DRAFT_173645 [Ramicandelaber brevisporus]|nr:hypothetical protein GQ42DRAFT_173645 [Ramicandelaber brevisporus]
MHLQPSIFLPVCLLASLCSQQLYSPSYTRRFILTISTILTMRFTSILLVASALTLAIASDATVADGIERNGKEVADPGLQHCASALKSKCTEVSYYGGYCYCANKCSKLSAAIKQCESSISISSANAKGPMLSQACKNLTKPDICLSAKQYCGHVERQVCKNKKHLYPSILGHCGDTKEVIVPIHCDTLASAYASDKQMQDYLKKNPNDAAMKKYLVEMSSIGCHSKPCHCYSTAECAKARKLAVECGAVFKT